MRESESTSCFSGFQPVWTCELGRSERHRRQVPEPGNARRWRIFAKSAPRCRERTIRSVKTSDRRGVTNAC